MVKACLTCVPGVVAGSPGQIPGEAVGQKEDGPGQHNDVVDVEQSNDHLGGITNPWNKKYHIRKGGSCVGYLAAATLTCFTRPLQVCKGCVLLV